MAEPQPVSSSFRDPAGFMFRQNGKYYRLIRKAYQPHYEQFASSGLLQHLQEKELLLRHTEVEINYPGENAYKVLEPEQIPVISYPYEWSFSQLKAAALLTLQIQKKALAHGMVLKDASAYNVQFIGSKPFFIDLLSFEKYEEGKPWAAYRQFCAHFLAPLALMSKTDISLNQLLQTNLDGIPLTLASKLLPKSTYLNMGLMLHLHLHSKAQQKLASSYKTSATKKFSKNAIIQLADSLESTIQKLNWQPDKTTWGNYYNETNYSPQGMEQKEQLVRQFLEKVKSTIILDLGANNGRFSKLATAFAPVVVSADIDPVAVEENFRQAEESGSKQILPLLLDITNPAPAIGWQNQERTSFLDRVKPDTILALALIHHLAIGNNLPLPRVAAFFAQSCKNLIIEFVPKSDSQVQKMLAGRKDIFAQYSQKEFENAFSEHFTILQKEQVGDSERVLFLMQKK